MNFIEAVQALKDGKCEGIRQPDKQTHCGKYFVIGITIPAILANDWELVNPITQYEEVEVIKYMVKGTSGDFFYDYRPGLNAIKLTGIDKREIKPKIKHRVEQEMWKVYPKDAKVFVEWEE